MSSSVADGITLIGEIRRKQGPRMVNASTFLIRVVLVVRQALVAERVPVPSAFVPDSASDRSTSEPTAFLEERVAQN